jgi:aspartokinase
MPDLQRKVHQQALNKTMTGVRTDMARAAQKEVTAKYGKLLETVTIKKATVNDSSAYVKSTGKRMPLGYFLTSQTKQGIRVQVYKDKSAKVLRHAFYLKSKDGSYKDVVWRKWHGESRPVKAGFAYGALPKQYRLPKIKRYSVSTPDALKRPGVLQEVIKQAGERLHTEYDRVLDNEMRKL